MLCAMIRPCLSLLAFIPILLSAAAPPVMPAGTYTNEEDRYFANERHAAAVPDWTGIEVSATQEWRAVDMFGKPLAAWQNTSPPLRSADGRIAANAANGVTTEMRRGTPFRCWLSLRRFAAKPDGSADYTFHPGLMLHDQGGRALVSDADAPGVVIRLRQVIWPLPSTNKPSLVLYVHKPEEPDHAVSYVWADPEAKLIGINLRWVQGSCSREGAGS